MSHELSTVSLLKLCSFLFWGWSYLWVSEKAPAHSPEWWSRAVTLLHGSVCSVVGLYQCGVTNINKCRLTGKSCIRSVYAVGPTGLYSFLLTAKITSAQYTLMLWSWGYFAFDLLWCLVYCSNSYVILGHHVSALIAVNIYMGKDYTGCTFACTLALMEITNPLLQMRWLLRDAGYGKTVVYNLIEIIYLLLFLSLRGPFCTYLIFKIMPSEILDVDEKMVSLALYIVSLLFIYEILGYVTYKYRNKIEEFRGFANEAGVLLNDTP